MLNGKGVRKSMFSTEYNGYNRSEVDKYIAKLKAEHEALLMEEKLKVLEAEKKVLDFKNKSYELENREKNIMSALDMFKKYQDEGNKKMENLRAIKMFYEQLLIMFEELKIQYPGIEHNRSYRKNMQDLGKILQQVSINEKTQLTTPAKTENDSMRLLLNKMQGYRNKEKDNPREVRIERAQDNHSQIKPVCDMTLEEGEGFDNLVDKFLSTEPEDPQPRSMKIQSSGFDLKEAINPKDDLAEIMKAFDFYNDDQE